MNRCFSPERWPVALLALFWLSAFATSVQAQPMLRQFPPTALRGVLQVTQSPEVLLNGVSARLSPGARLKDSSNMLRLPATLSGQRLLVNYVRDPQGLLHEVWILTSAEAQEPRAGLEPVTNFSFASDADRPKTDDGKTPFHQLPVFPNR
ncbi:MAG: hypothetical protein WBI20_13220 [Burkholderiaceae bacterium]